jgi:hypothetical protein
MEMEWLPGSIYSFLIWIAEAEQQMLNHAREIGKSLMRKNM